MCEEGAKSVLILPGVALNSANFCSYLLKLAENMWLFRCDMVFTPRRGVLPGIVSWVLFFANGEDKTEPSRVNFWSNGVSLIARYGDLLSGPRADRGGVLGSVRLSLVDCGFNFASFSSYLLKREAKKSPGSVLLLECSLGRIGKVYSIVLTR